jgi:type I restriction-modification system DNA methylase subunit
LAQELQGKSNVSWLASIIWGIADDVLRDLYVRGKCRGVILPMDGIRRLDSVPEPTKQAVIDMKATLDAKKKEDPIKIGYETRFIRYFDKPQTLRTLEEIRLNILTIEKEAERLHGGLLKSSPR